MSRLVRAWALSAVVTTVAELGVGAVVASDPPGALTAVVPALALGLSVLVVGVWFRRRSPDAPAGEYLIAVLPFPALVWVLGLSWSARTGTSAAALLAGAVADLVLMIAATAAFWARGPIRRRLASPHGIIAPR